MSGAYRRLSFVGPPGSGKSTQIRLLATALKGRCLVASVPRLVRGDPSLLALLTDEERAEVERLRTLAEAARRQGLLAPVALDRLLFAALQRVPESRPILLDGCPRGLEQAQLYCTPAPPSDALVVHLTFARDPLHGSLARQYLRDQQRHGREAAAQGMAKYWQKWRVYCEQTCAGLRYLQSHGIPIYILDAGAPACALLARILPLLAGTVDGQPALPDPGARGLRPGPAWSVVGEGGGPVDRAVPDPTGREG
jgi:hypothetical protein